MAALMVELFISLLDEVLSIKDEGLIPAKPDPGQGRRRARAFERVGDGGLYPLLLLLQLFLFLLLLFDCLLFFILFLSPSLLFLPHLFSDFLFFLPLLLLLS